MKSKNLIAVLFLWGYIGLIELQSQNVSKLTTLTDIDGNKYNIIKISDQVWSAENLNVGHFRNGDSIPEIKTDSEWAKAGEEGSPAWCYYEYNVENGKKYGKLYNWFAVNDIRGLAPKGWHIPGNKEWKQLIDFLGGEKEACIKMKSIAGWGDDGNGTSVSGFNCLPGGFHGFGNSFNEIGNKAYWWSSTEGNSLRGYMVRVTNEKDGKVEIKRYYKNYGFSVRCIKD